MDIQQQESCKILLIGDSCTDKFHYGVCDRISPEAPVSVFKHLRTEVRDGMCLNVRNNMLAFDFADITVITNSDIISKERFVDANSGQHLLRTDFGENKKINPLTFSHSLEESVAGYDYVVVSDYEKGYITYETAERVLDACRDHKVPAFVDSKKRDLSCYYGAFIKINEKEYDVLDKTTVEESNLIVTRGRNGAMWQGVHYPADVVEVADVSGAGDTFLSALVYGYHLHGNLMEAIKIANKCSSFVVQKSGTYSLSKKDVKNLCI